MKDSKKVIVDSKYVIALIIILLKFIASYQARLLTLMFHIKSAAAGPLELK